MNRDERSRLNKHITAQGVLSSDYRLSSCGPRSGLAWNELLGRFARMRK